MTWLVIGTFRPLTTRASRRSTRNCMSTSPSRSEARVPQEKQRFLADLCRAYDTRAWRGCGRMLLVKTRHYKCIGGQSRGEAGVRQSRIRELDVDERWIAEREIEWFDGWLVQERERSEEHTSELQSRQ